MTTRFISVALAAALLFPGAGAYAQKQPSKKKQKTTSSVPDKQPEQAQKPSQPADDKTPKPFHTIVTKDAKSQQGFIAVHQVKDKYYFEIPDSVLGRDLLVVGRIVKAPAGDKKKVGYPGDYLDESVIRFDLAPKGQNKVYIRDISYLERATDVDNMYTAVANSNVQPISAVFDVKSYRTDSVSKIRTTLIDVTDYIKGDKGVFGLPDNAKKSIGAGGAMPEASYTESIKTFPINLEVRTVRTYMGASNLTYELNNSVVLLPKEPMKPRFYDPRVGYFAVNYTDYDSNPQGIEKRALITRWRLEPKDEDIEKYKRGELVEPKKPIVIYIDPATPKKWIPYLIQGVNDWQPAFEKAGFKNAIQGRMAPVDDPTWSLEDARHSAIVYKPSDIANASGPHVHDPRSGEIIETHINWYHNIMELLRNWYMVQAGPIDPAARTVNFDDALMGELIRFVSSHEVGHTLGLRHNMGSSATVPVEKLRDKAWTDANGHTPSIMDYARFNYVAQPEDNVTRKGIFPRIGIYDDWSIEWGYRWLPQFATAEEEIPFSNQSIIAKLKEDVRYTFGGEMDRFDPRNQSEAVGDDAMKAGEYGIKNLRRIVPEIIDWTREPDRDYAKAAVLYAQVVGQLGRYAGHVVTYVGGTYTTPLTTEESDKKFRENVPAALQHEAVEFLNKQLFTTPAWLIDQQLIELAGVNPISSIGSIQATAINQLLSSNTINRLVQQQALDGKKAYSTDQLFADLRKGVWTELYTGKAPDIYRRNLQKSHVDALVSLLGRSAPAAASNPQQQQNPQGQRGVTVGGGDAAAVARAQLGDLNRQIKAASNASSGLARAHYQNLAAMIDSALKVD